MGRRKRRMQDAKRPLLSIFVSVYNLESYIEQCLDSILQQPFQDYEILLFDNGSVDRSIEICTGYAQRYPDKIRYYKLPLPTVVGRPHHLACTRMRGRYFMQIDGDDYLASGALQRIADCIQREQADIIMGTFTSIAESGAQVMNDADFEANKINGVSYRDAVLYLAALPRFHTVNWRFILKRRVLWGNGPHKSKRLCKKIQKRSRSETDIHGYLQEKHAGQIGRMGDIIHTVGLFECSQSISFMETPFYVYRRRANTLTAIPELKGSFLAGDILITVLRLAMGKFRLSYAVLKIEHLMEMYRQLCCLNSAEEEADLADAIQKFRKPLRNLTKYDIPELRLLYGLVQQLGERRGLSIYREQQTEKLVEGCKDFLGKPVYAFPTGFCGEATAELLDSEGIPVSGFLDNNPDKDEACIRGRICHVPQKLLGISDQEKQNTAVVISTSYPKLSPVLQNQLIALGIPERNIYIR